MPKFIDYSELKIGRVLIIKNVEKGINSRWECLCDCGKTFQCLSRSFKRGELFECEPCRFERRRGIDLSGRRYGRWTVLNREVDKNNKTQWIVKCDCGVVGKVSTYSLGRPGKSMSCGCLGRKEKSKYVNETLYPPLHKTSLTGIYNIRTRIIHSCYKESHPTYKLYGAKGYTVCELWRNSALDFYNWCVENNWKKAHVVAIKDESKIYSPENCYVIDESEYLSQRLQKKVTHNGITKTLRDWAEFSKVKFTSIAWRLNHGYSIEEAIFCKAHQFSGRHRSYPDEEIKSLYESGLSLADVGRQVGVGYVAVGKRLRLMGFLIDQGIKRRKYKPIPCCICKKNFTPNGSGHKKCIKCKAA